MHRFFAADAAERETILLDENESKHARSVLRVRDGETAELLDGQGRRFGAQIDGTENGRVRVRRLTELPGNEPEVRVTLYPGLPKLDKLDFVVQKAAELGAARVVPVEMERSVARISGDGAKKRERWERIAREAAKQCGRGRVPEVLAPLSWKEALVDMRARELLLVPWEEAGMEGQRLQQVFAAHTTACDIGILIGPEGGISAEEIEQSGGERVTLGPRILRTETASVAALSVVMSLWGDI
ncbi:MAG: 16S rRNA (uracil(1498)-N(3))-methyltransferase [Clostridiales bacterium]|nr:16S rRNA (uracil(1498)-N(3))-methyltransferase [Clostridiales bacterium]